MAGKPTAANSGQNVEAYGDIFLLGDDQEENLDNVDDDDLADDADMDDDEVPEVPEAPLDLSGQPLGTPEEEPEPEDDPVPEPAPRNVTFNEETSVRKFDVGLPPKYAS